MDMLCELIESMQGVCRHSSFIFYALALYYGIPVRILKSDHGIHQWCEYSLDGHSWKQFENTDLDIQQRRKEVPYTYNVSPQITDRSVKWTKSSIRESIAEQAETTNKKFDPHL